MIARRPIALPSVAHPVERFEPEVAPIFGACSAADKNSSARSEDAVERGSIMYLADGSVRLRVADALRRM